MSYLWALGADLAQAERLAEDYVSCMRIGDLIDMLGELVHFLVPLYPCKNRQRVLEEVQELRTSMQPALRQFGHASDQDQTIKQSLTLQFLEDIEPAMSRLSRLVNEVASDCYNFVETTSPNGRTTRKPIASFAPTARFGCRNLSSAHALFRALTPPELHECADDDILQNSFLFNLPSPLYFQFHHVNQLYLNVFSLCKTRQVLRMTGLARIACHFFAVSQDDANESATVAGPPESIPQQLHPYVTHFSFVEYAILCGNIRDLVGHYRFGNRLREHMWITFHSASLAAYRGELEFVGVLFYDVFASVANMSPSSMEAGCDNDNDAEIRQQQQPLPPPPSIMDADNPAYVYLRYKLLWEPGTPQYVQGVVQPRVQEERIPVKHSLLSSASSVAVVQPKPSAHFGSVDVYEYDQYGPAQHCLQQQQQQQQQQRPLWVFVC
jgi:hypothetical protein